MNQMTPAVEEKTDPNAQPTESAPATEESIPEQPAPATPAGITEEPSGEDKSAPAKADTIKKALKDTKAWATKVSQDNAVLRQALEAAAQNPPPALLSDPQVADRLDHVKKSLGDFEEMGPLLDLLDNVINGVGAYEREVAHHALVHSVLEEHPDALEIRRDSNFHAWVDRQPPAVRHCLHHSPNPRDASWILGVYKKECQARKSQQARSAEQAQRQHRMRHAASPSPQTGSAPAGPRWTRGDIASMSLEDYRRNENAIDSALARGEIS